MNAGMEECNQIMFNGCVISELFSSLARSGEILFRCPEHASCVNPLRLSELFCCRSQSSGKVIWRKHKNDQRRGLPMCALLTSCSQEEGLKRILSVPSGPMDHKTFSWSRKQIFLLFLHSFLLLNKKSCSQAGGEAREEQEVECGSSLSW
jgi:hypothetical protein